jgi:hypothetical protein
MFPLEEHRTFEQQHMSVQKKHNESFICKNFERF